MTDARPPQHPAGRRRARTVAAAAALAVAVLVLGYAAVPRRRPADVGQNHAFAAGSRGLARPSTI